MSEVMAIESIAEEYAKFKGYLTQTRVPFKFRKGNSDFDVIGFNPKTKNSLVIECKAWGSPNQYFNFETPRRINSLKNRLKEIIEKWDYFVDSPNNKWKFSEMDDIWLVIPGICGNGFEEQMCKELNHRIKIIPIHELILRIIDEVKEDKNLRRKRYSNPALEFCRWLLRSYENGYLSLIDLDSNLKNENRTYEVLKRNYFKECMRAVQKNVEKRKAFINTRINTLKVLSKIRRGTISEIAKRAPQRYDLDNSRIKVGLGTWKELGVVARDQDDEYFIVDSFSNIVKDSL